jgi:hypothetical protein
VSHEATSPPALDPARCVFINCPFDAAYEPNLQAIVLGCVACGFTPRCAIDSGAAAAQRLSRILEGLCSCHLSIHDLSRCQGEGEEAPARFNMPLELGMAIARRHVSPDLHPDMLILVPQGHQYVRFVSDLAGIDPAPHDGTPPMVLRRVMAWLASYTVQACPKPPEVERHLVAFGDVWRQGKADWGEVRWWTMVRDALYLLASS